MRIFLDTYGCTLNKADSYVIRNLLAKHTFVPLAESEAVIVNTCAVKNATESRMVSTIKKYINDERKVIVAGCLPKINRHILDRFDVSVVDCNSYNHLPAALEEIKNGNKVVFLSDDHKDKLKMLYGQDKNDTAIVPIAEGCISSCSYCATKHARGNLTSHEPDEIIALITTLIKNGKKKIMLTAQDTGCYGFDIKTNLSELLEKIAAIDGDFIVRVGMMNPQHIKQQLTELIKIFKNPKIIPFLHVPVQSGSDKVLKDMKRGYCVNDFLDIVEKFKKESPDIYVSTDIIVGFPTETDKDFEKTIGLIKKIQPNNVNISKFYPRPQTAAKKMKQLPTQIKKERSCKLAKLCRESSLK